MPALIPEFEDTRRGLLARGASLVGALALLPGVDTKASAKDYATRRQALDDLDRLASICGMRLGMVRRERPASMLLVSRFLKALEGHRERREDVRRRFGLPRGLDPASQVGEADPDLSALRQALDDLMVAYAESLPALGDASMVARLATDMVEVARLRTVIDLWVVAEEA